MTIQEEEPLKLYVEECIDHLVQVENDLLSIEEAGADVDEEIVNRVFRAAHSIKGGAANLVAKGLSRTALELENMGKAGNLKRGTEALKELETGLNDLENYVRTL